MEHLRAHFLGCVFQLKYIILFFENSTILSSFYLHTLVWRFIEKYSKSPSNEFSIYISDFIPCFNKFSFPFYYFVKIFSKNIKFRQTNFWICCFHIYYFRTFHSSQLLSCFYANMEIPCLVLDGGKSIELIVAPIWSRVHHSF